MRLHFADSHLRPGMEVDSRIEHGRRTDVQRNSDKWTVLVAPGWRVLRFNWGDVRGRPAYFVDAVARGLVLAWPV